MKKCFSCCLAVILAAALGGCVSRSAKKDVASSDEYETVTPLGSNIPVRVKKGQKPVGSSPTEEVNASQAANALHGAGGQKPSVPGQTP